MLAEIMSEVTEAPVILQPAKSEDKLEIEKEEAGEKEAEKVEQVGEKAVESDEKVTESDEKAEETKEDEKAEEKQKHHALFKRDLGDDPGFGTI